MGFVRAILLALGLLVFGCFGFIASVLALMISPIFPKMRFFSNAVFLTPFSYYSRAVTGVKLTILNRERIYSHRPAIFVGNHQSGLDLAFISQACPARSVIVGKREILRIPIFGWFFWIAGNLLIDRSDQRSAKAQIEKVRDRLKAHDLNLAIFPEGTRSKTGELLPFKRGAFYLAASTGYPLIPVVCSNLKGKAIWETFDIRGGHVVISVLPPIEMSKINLSDLAAISEQVRQLMVDEYARVTELAKHLDLR